MASPESEAIREAWRSLMTRLASNPDLDMITLRDITESTARLAAEPAHITYEEIRVAGLPALRCTPVDRDADAVIVYLHGGGYNNQSKDTVRKLAGHLARAARLEAVVPDYRLAPEHPWPVQLEDILAVVTALRRSSTARIVLAGESAGGSLAISAALALRDRPEEQVAAISAFSPYVDLLGEGAGFTAEDGRDLFLSRHMAQVAAGMLLDQATLPTDPVANLVYADPAKLPPLFLNAGGDENLAGGIAELACRAEAAGVDVTVTITPEMQHAFVYMAGRAPEADAAIADAGRWIRSRLSPLGDPASSRTTT